MDRRIEAEMYAYNMCGSSPCEYCNEFRHITTEEERDMIYAFLKHPNPKKFINEFSTYDKNKSFTRNCVDFLKKMEEEGKMYELWKQLNNEKNENNEL